MKNFIKLSASIIVFLAIVYNGVQTIRYARANQVLKIDLAELNHFKYGLFSVDSWKQRLSVIISAEIDRLSLSGQNRKDLQEQLAAQLVVLIDKINERMVRQNMKTTEGKIKQTLIDSFVDMDDIKAGTPEYAAAILKEISSPKTEAQVKSLLKERINKYMKGTFDSLPDVTKVGIIRKYGSLDEAATKKELGDRRTRLQRLVNWHSTAVIVLALLLFLMEGLSRKPLPPSQYIILTLSLVALLTVGVTTPMIDMEAKIAQLNFVLLGHPIAFKDQMLYFQSKSIIDVFRIMITHPELQMKLVGLLMVAFSIIFPILKMLSSLAYYYDYGRAKQHRIIQFLVLRSGKWSMADVVVVAIFMSFIGFNGIINSQLSDLKSSSAGMDVLTTNGTSLQPGFYLFFTYTVLAMFLAGFLKSRPYQRLKPTHPSRAHLPEEGEDGPQQVRLPASLGEVENPPSELL